MFSDFAYLDRAVTLSVSLVFIVHRLAASGNLRGVFSWNTLRRVELKSVAVLLLLVSLVSMLVYDCVATYIKYREGFYVDQVTGLIITRPGEKYDERDRKLFPSIAVLQNLSMTLQCSAVFLMMALWNHMAKAMLNKQFMSSGEFKAYAIYSVVTLGLYPFLQIVYFISRNVLVSTVVPLFLYSFQCLLIIVLTQGRFYAPVAWLSL